jgi:hypothetical protein
VERINILLPKNMRMMIKLAQEFCKVIFKMGLGETPLLESFTVYMDNIDIKAVRYLLVFDKNFMLQVNMQVEAWAINTYGFPISLRSLNEGKGRPQRA